MICRRAWDEAHKRLGPKRSLRHVQKHGEVIHAA